MTAGTLQQDYERYLELLRGRQANLVGIGVTAFNRIGPGLFYPEYEIVGYKDSSDIDCLKKIVPIKTIQADFRGDGDINRNNTLAILQHAGVQKYLSSKSGVKVFVYRTTERIDALCDSLGYEVFANRHDIRDRFENKDEFFHIGRKIGLPMIPGTQLNVAELTDDRYRGLQEEVGKRLVFQLTEIFRGGGQGTFFINSVDDLERFRAFVAKQNANPAKTKVAKVNVTRFISGPSPSITGCATRHGVLTGVVQTQILDVPELVDRDRDGVYLGHDWGASDYDPLVQKQADAIAQKLGAYMYAQGYRGIFGIDLIVDDETGKVYPVECNPRYTGAFPVYTMLQVAYGEIPLDVFQLLEFFDIDYPLDFEAVNRSWKTPKSAAHVTLHNLHKERWARVNGQLTAGTYRLVKRKTKKLKNKKTEEQKNLAYELERVGDGVLFSDLHREDEFVVTDGCPRPGTVVKPRLRVGKLVFRRRILERPGVLSNFAMEAYRAVMRGFDLQVVSAEEQTRLDKEYGYE